MLPQLLLFLGVCITSTLSQADVEHLNDEILPLCFEHHHLSNGGELYINGQKEPLANSLENFISLIEKLELANPDMKLEDEIYFLLKNYTAENVHYNERSDTSDAFFSIWMPSPAKMDIFERLWEPLKDKRLPDLHDPFQRNEKCSLFFMLSHTVNDTARLNLDQRLYSPDKETQIERAAPKTVIPREQGVVAINGSKTHAVALGRVLLGLYVGLKPKTERMKSLDDYTFSQKTINLDDVQAIDILYLVTLADQLVLPQYPLETESKRGFGKNGQWRYIKFPSVVSTFDDLPVCPTIYELPENNTSAFTYSSVRGGVDGLILGEIISDIASTQQNLRLSQILRMYYGRNGLHETSNAPPSNDVISFCKRLVKISLKEDTLKKQMKVFLAFVSNIPSTDIHRKAVDEYEKLKKQMMMPNGDMEDKCKQLDEAKGARKCEAAIDVIFVMDTTQKSDRGDIEMQQEIIGHIANRLDMGYGGSTVTVFSDQKNGTSGLQLISLISNTSSSACAACSAIQMQIDNAPPAEKDVIVESVNLVLKDVDDQEKSLNGAKGKVVIFFNFQDEEDVSYRLQRALRNLYTSHVGVQFFAVGNNKEVMKIYTQNQLQNVVSVLGTLSHEIADTVATKICEIPSKLQYEDCKLRRNEASAVYEGLISPNSIQRWAMYPKYFYKSLTPKMFFKSDYGVIEVCQSRAYSRAEDHNSHCRTFRPSERPIEFNTTNPCRGFNEHNCAPWYFTVSYVENPDEVAATSSQYCQDTNTVRCRTLDQIKFTVSHDGIRCSSCSGLFSTPGLLLACFAIYIVTKVLNIDV